MRTGTGNKLSKKEKAAIRANLDQATRDMAEVYQEDDREISKIAKEKGIEWVTPDPSLGEAVAEFRSHDTPRVIELAKSRGVKDPEPKIGRASCRERVCQYV